MDILEETYRELKRLGLTKNQCDFSTTWHSKSKRYYSMIRASDHEPSVDAITRLAANLKYRHHFYETNRLGELRQHAEGIYPLVKKVWTEVYQKALVPPKSQNQGNIWN